MMGQVVQVHSSILITGLDETTAEAIRARLTYENPELAEAKRSGRFTKNIPEKLNLWQDEDEPVEALRVPRGTLHWILDMLPEAEVRDLRICPQVQLKTPGVLEPRWYQAEAIRAALRSEQGVIVAPTGSGKTATAMGLIERLQTPTLILVHNKTLLEQAASACRLFLGIRPGMIGDGACNVQDVTIATVQTLMNLNLQQFAGRFGCVILDEAHHCPADTFRAVISAFPAKYRFGLTATPTRADGLTDLMIDTIGPIVYRVSADVLMTAGAIVPAEVVVVHTDFDCDVPMKPRRFRGTDGRTTEIDYTKLINALCKDPARNDLIVDRVCALHYGQSLVLTERVEHAELLADRLHARGLRAVYLSGKTTKKNKASAIEDFKAGDIDILVSTVALVGEGFDCPNINSVFLAAPNGNITKTTQALGRALRPAPGKTNGRIVDFVDDKIKILESQAKRRNRVYKQFKNNGALAA